MKILIAVFAAAFLCFPSRAQARWGMDFTASWWEMDAKDFKRTMSTYGNSGNTDNESIKRDSLGGAASFYIEGKSKSRFGLSFGYGAMPNASIKLERSATDPHRLEIVNRTTYIPVDLYYKFGSKGGKAAFFLGGGADYIMAKSEYRQVSGVSDANNDVGTFKAQKTVPHAKAGFEFFLTRGLSFGCSAKYVMSGVISDLQGNETRNGTPRAGKRRLVMDTYGSGVAAMSRPVSSGISAGNAPLQYDYTGLRMELAMRWNFGGRN